MLQESEAAVEANEREVISTIKQRTLILEYQLLQKYAPVGVYLVPGGPNESWSGVYFCKQGIY